MARVRIERERFSSVDAAWLRMERPTSMAMITGIFMFDAPVDYERVVALAECRLLPYKRFAQRVRYPRLGLGSPTWETDPHFNVRSHVHRIALPAPGDQAALQQVVGDLMSTPLDFSKPLWQWHLVENVGGGCALVVRLHHCVADGLALMDVLLSLTDDRPDADWPTPKKERRDENGFLYKMLKPVVDTVDGTFQFSKGIVRAGLDTLVDPSRVLDAAAVGASGVGALGKLLLIPPDHKTIFKGDCGVPKVAAWSQPIPVAEIKAIGKTLHNSTINDVLMAAVTGALRRYLESREQPVEGLNIRAIVPVNLRKPHEKDPLGNRFGLVFLSLPVGLRDPIRRLHVLKRRMDAIKHTPEAVVAFGILSAMGMTTTQIEDIIMHIFAVKGTLVMTNVPGPRKQLYFANQPLKSIMFWVPAPANLGMGVSIMSYAGNVLLGVQTDACLVPDPDTIIELFHDELASMRGWSAAKVPGDAEMESVQQLEAVTLVPVDVGTTLKKAAAVLREMDAVPVAMGVDGHSTTRAPRNGHTAGAHGAHRCHAVTAAGKPCKNAALPGGELCRVHATRVQNH